MQQQNNNNLQTILVCGGAGYIGSHTVLELLRSNQFNVVVYDNFATGYRESLAAVQTLFKQMPERANFLEIFEGDVLDDSALDKCFTTFKIDAVMVCSSPNLHRNS